MSSVDELDEIDKAIIEVLQIDGRVSYADLGPQVGLSQAAARQRVRRLLDDRVIQVVAVTDPAQVGFGLQVMVGLSVEGDIRKIASALAEIDEVPYVIVTTGRFDLIIEVVCEDTDALLELMNHRVRGVDGVRSTEIFTYLDLVKQTYAWGTR
ncbi:Lrp/AsnC family transcriptional regulator [Actinospongicola halichondriae]|uniref:Lrp/AsnC family transcriptional regulator n=1 Tax=Actinospongicola halichondriae TaxID=3236844 RepID=UPI003D41A1A2